MPSWHLGTGATTGWAAFRLPLKESKMQIAALFIPIADLGEEMLAYCYFPLPQTTETLLHVFDPF